MWRRRFVEVCRISVDRSVRIDIFILLKELIHRVKVANFLLYLLTIDVDVSRFTDNVVRYSFRRLNRFSLFNNEIIFIDSKLEGIK